MNKQLYLKNKKQIRKNYYNIYKEQEKEKTYLFIY